MRKLLLRQLIKDVGLYPFYRPTPFSVATGRFLHPALRGHNASCHRIEAACHRLLQKRAEFDGAVAVNAWVRRVSRTVFANKAIDYLLAEAT